MTKAAGVAGAQRALYVVDTSSIIQVRQDMAQETQTKVTAVCQKLIHAAQADQLVFSKAVVDEILVGPTKAATGPDPASGWATACKALAVPDHGVYGEAREVLGPVPDLLDVAKTTTTDEADPYVVGLALKRQREGNQVIVDHRGDEGLTREDVDAERVRRHGPTHDLDARLPRAPRHLEGAIDRVEKERA